MARSLKTVKRRVRGSVMRLFSCSRGLPILSIRPRKARLALDRAGEIAIIRPSRPVDTNKSPFCGENLMSRSTSEAPKSRGSFTTVAAFLFGFPVGVGLLYFLHHGPYQ